jgi:Cu/Zn superoxide dismutase
MCTTVSPGGAALGSPGHQAVNTSGPADSQVNTSLPSGSSSRRKAPRAAVVQHLVAGDGRDVEAPAGRADARLECGVAVAAVAGDQRVQP